MKRNKLLWLKEAAVFAVAAGCAIVSQSGIENLGVEHLVGWAVVVGVVGALMRRRMQRLE